MSSSPSKIPLVQYQEAASPPPVFCIVARPTNCPVDINVQFLSQTGWSESGDRLRFHYQHTITSSHPLAQLLGSAEPHVIIRHHDREEDRLVAVQIQLSGDIHVLSNDEEYARQFFAGAFLEFPPGFRTLDDFDISEEWIEDPARVAMFAGMVAGSFSWDPSHDCPPAIRASLEEAQAALSIANYRSCVVMCRRTLEALLKFAFVRLLHRPAEDRRGHTLSLNAMIDEFRREASTPIPIHLLHIADSLRLVGNVPGAHAAEIPNYQFTRYDAEFALASMYHFLNQYFSKIDPEVSQYFTLTIDLDSNDEDTGPTAAVEPSP